jgi:phosphoribosylformylglycinamidine synthase PurS subunit
MISRFRPAGSPVGEVAWMPRVAVDVMLKREILDPQGQAVERALPALGFAGVSDVRVGKHVELTVTDGDGEEAARRMAKALLANPVIEEFSVRLLPD